jgi:hypothetical protein
MTWVTFHRELTKYRQQDRSCPEWVTEPAQVKCDVDVCPQLDRPALRCAALAAGLLGPETSGLALGYFILILRAT